MSEMRDAAQELAARLIRNVDGVALTHFLRGSMHESQCSSLSQGTAARKLATAVDTLPPGMRSCPCHVHHAEEEMFIVLEGTGTLRVAGHMLPIKAGDVVFIPPGPEYPHHILNTSDAPLKSISIGTNEPVEVCEYPDSGKYMVGAPNFHAIHRKGGDIDYRDGEVGTGQRPGDWPTPNRAPSTGARHRSGIACTAPRAAIGRRWERTAARHRSCSPRCWPGRPATPPSRQRPGPAPASHAGAGPG